MSLNYKDQLGFDVKLDNVRESISKAEKGILIRKRLEEELSSKKKPVKKETTEVKKEEPKKE